jgi:hypothetical protein
MSAFGIEQTSDCKDAKSAFDPKETSPPGGGGVQPRLWRFLKYAEPVWPIGGFCIRRKIYMFKLLSNNPQVALLKENGAVLNVG